MEEIWIKAEIDTELNYEVSSYGRVRLIRPRKKAIYLNSFICKKTKSLLVQLTILKYKSKKRQLKQMNKIVLNSFFGGYYKQRKVKHLNGILHDCRLSNLEWRDGFKTGIKLKEVLKIDNKSLDYCGIQIKEFLIKKNDESVYNIIKKHRGLLFYVFKENNFVSRFDDFINDLFMLMKSRLESGRFTPLEGERIKSYMAFRAKHWIIDERRYFSKQKEIAYKVYYFKKELTKNIEINDNYNIRDEVSEIFSQLAS